MPLEDFLKKISEKMHPQVFFVGHGKISKKASRNFALCRSPSSIASRTPNWHTFFSRVVFILMCYCCCLLLLCIIIIILCHTASQSCLYTFYSLAPFHCNNNIKFLYECIMANISHLVVIQNSSHFLLLPRIAN